MCANQLTAFWLEIIVIRGTFAARSRQKYRYRLSVKIGPKSIADTACDTSVEKYRRYSIGIAIDTDTNNPGCAEQTE